MHKALLSLAISVLLWIGSVFFGSTPAMPAAAAGEQKSDFLNEIKQSDSWSLVNATPYPMSPAAAALCRNLTKQEYKGMLHEAGRLFGPHADYFVSVRVNQTGEKAMRSGSAFPKGTIIIKDKFAPSAHGIELSTVMIKRDKGFNPKCGDWEFAVLNGKGDKVMVHGKLESCMSCHQRQAKLDYTYRTYVPSRRAQ